MFCCRQFSQSILLRSNRITLQAPAYRVFNHAIWPINTRHPHSLCCKTCYNSAKPPETSVNIRKSPKNAFVFEFRLLYTALQKSDTLCSFNSIQLYCASAGGAKKVIQYNPKLVCFSCKNRNPICDTKLSESLLTVQFVQFPGSQF